MKTGRQSKILELIREKNIETQEELTACLEQEGYAVTQATVSRDIKELKLTKIQTEDGRQKYAVIGEDENGLRDRYVRVLREGFVSVDMAENLVVVKTVSGMASAVCAAVDAMKLDKVLGSIAGDDTLLMVIRSEKDAKHIVEYLKRLALY